LNCTLHDFNCRRFLSDFDRAFALLVNVLAVKGVWTLDGLSFGVYFKRFGVWHVSRFISARRTEPANMTPHFSPLD